MPKAKVYNTLWDLHNSLDHTQAEFKNRFIIKFKIIYTLKHTYFD